MFKEANTPRFLRSLSNHSDPLGVIVFMVDSQDFERNTCLTGSQIENWLNWLVLNFYEFLDHSLTRDFCVASSSKERRLKEPPCVTSFAQRCAKHLSPVVSVEDLSK
jgi:hypothetical protein